MSIDKEFRWTGTVNRDLADKYGWWHTEAEKRVAGDVTVAKRLARSSRTWQRLSSQ